MALDRVQPLKLEDPGTGGDDTDQFPTELDPQEDYIECSGLVLDTSSTRDEQVYIDRDGDALRFNDADNSNVLLSDLLTAERHAALRQLIHLADGVGGPMEGWASGAYREVTGTVLPTAIIWWTSSGKTAKIVSKEITYTSTVFPSTITWKAYASDGSTVLATVVDTISYSGPFETSRTRTISGSPTPPTPAKDIYLSVRVATVANVNLASAPATIDDITMASGDRVLVWQQSTGSQNGIYTYPASSGLAMTRATDFDDASEMLEGLEIWVRSGTLWASKTFTHATVPPITVGSTALVFKSLDGPTYSLKTTVAHGGAEATLLTIAVPDNTKATYRVLVDGQASSETCKCAIVGVFTRSGGGSASQKTNLAALPSYKDDAAWNPRIAASGNNVTVLATPDSANDTTYIVQVWEELKALA